MADVSFDDLIPSKSSPPSGGGLSFDDLIPKPTTDQGVKGDIKIAGEAFLRGLPATGGFWAGAGAGAALAAPAAAAAGAATGPAAPLVVGAVELLGGLAGGMVGAYGVEWAVDKLNSIMDPEGHAAWKQAQQEHPKSAMAGGFASGFAGSSWKTVPEAAGKLWTKPIVQRGASGTLMGGFDAAQQLAQTGEVDPKQVVASAAGGFALPGANVAGKLAHAAGAGTAGLIRPGKPEAKPSDVPDRPPPGATPEEKANYLKKLQEIKAERDAKSPIVEAVIRNKETGTIEKMGPKHDDARKAETVDTHDQGFVDERGNFLDRKQAWERAKNTGQIPEGQNPEFPAEGLHSGDLRIAGDERFKVTEEQPQGEPKPPEEAPKEPTTREEFKKTIDDLEYRKDTTLQMDLMLAEDAQDSRAVSELLKEEQDLTTKLEQLHKDIPDTKFKDGLNPTWEELQDHLWRAKDLGTALDILTSTGVGSKGKRILLKAFAKSDFIRSAALNFSTEHLPFTGKGGVESLANGLYYGENSHLVVLGKGGDLGILIHEAAHAGTHKLLTEGNSFAAQRMKALFEKYLASHGATGEYGFTDIHEFVSEAFSNKDFQTLLSSIEVGKQPRGKILSLWDEFKDTVRNGLNLPENTRTAFDEVMEVGQQLIEKSAGEKPGPYGKKTGATPSKVEMRPVEPATEAPIDRTKTSPRDVANEKEMYEIATDIYEKHGETEAVKFYEGYKEYQKTWLEPVAETEKFVGINLRNKLAKSRLIENEKKKMQEEVPDPARREAISIAVDKGDFSSLSGKDLEVAQRYAAAMEDIGNRAVNQGVLSGLLDNYVSHILEWTGVPKGAKEDFLRAFLGGGERDPSMRGMSTDTKFAKERKHKTFADLQMAIDEFNLGIEEAGRSPWRLQFKTKDISEIYKEYSLSMEKAIENKSLIDNLKQVRGPTGDLMIREVNKENPLLRGHEMIPSPQFSGMSIRSDLLPALKFVFDAGPGDIMKALGAISQATKRMNVIGSFFHAKSLMEVLSSTGIPIWTPVKAVTLGGVDKLLGTKFSGLTKAVDQYRKGGAGDNVDKWITEGRLQLEVPEDVSQGILTSTGKFADSLIAKYGPKTRALEKTLSTVEKYTLGYFDKFTWDFLHTGGKIMVADAYLDKARIAAAKEGKPFDETAARIEISRSVNESFGGLNWFDAATQSNNEFAKRLGMAAFSPEGRRGMQVALFAPDWTVSTLRSFVSALPKELNPLKWHPIEGAKGMMAPTTKADYARLYQFKTALTYFTLLNAINLMTANRPIWENKDPSRIEWPDGTSMQAMKHAMEPYHWIADPDKTLSNKLGFLPKAAIVGFGGVEYASPTAQKLVDPSGPGRIKAVAQMALPFQLQAGAAAPEGEGAKRALLGTLGFPVYGSTPAQKKEARRERTKQLKEAARKYHQTAKEKGWE